MSDGLEAAALRVTGFEVVLAGELVAGVEVGVEAGVVDLTACLARAMAALASAARAASVSGSGEPISNVVLPVERA